MTLINAASNLRGSYDNTEKAAETRFRIASDIDALRNRLQPSLAVATGHAWNGKPIEALTHGELLTAFAELSDHANNLNDMLIEASTK